MRPVADLLLTDHAVSGALVAFNSPTAMESQVFSWMETNNGDRVLTPVEVSTQRA
jgi:hypothetical protein